MVALGRKQSKIFASNAPLSQITVFRTTESDSPQTSNDPNTIQNDKYLSGWLNADNSGNEIPYAEDMNAVLYTLSYNTSYLYEKGIPEYSSTQIYYVNSFCQYQGRIYRCKLDDTLNYVPTTTERWDEIPTSSYSATNIGTGDGSIYAGISNNQFQFKRLVAGSNVLITETSDSVTIASTGGGGGASFIANAPLVYNNGILSIQAATSSQNGYLTAADWTSFNSKLSNTIFSSNNTWTGTNTFNKILPYSGNSTIGDSSNLWAIYSSSIFGDENFSFEFKDQRIENSRFVLGLFGNEFGFIPITSSTDGYSSTLGTSLSKWNNLYVETADIQSLNNLYNITAPYSSSSQSRIGLNFRSDSSSSTTFAYLGKSSSYTGLIPAATDTYYLGSSSYRWKVYASDLYATTFKPTSNNSGSIGDSNYHWSYIYANHISANSNIVVHNSIIPDTTGTYDLGGVISSTTYRFNSGYFKCATIQSNGIIPTSTGYVLGNSTTQWNSVYTGGVYANSSALEVGGNSSSVFYLRPSSTATSNDLGSANSPWQVLHLSAGASNGIYFGSDLSHSYVKDVTNNTLVLNATSTVQVQNGGTRNYTFASSSFYPTGSKDLGTTSNYWGKSYISEINIHANSGITTYLTNDGIQFLWKTSGTSGSLVSTIGYHTYFMPSATNTINLGSGDNRWKTIYTNNSVNVSDRRSKEDIEELDNGLEKIRTIGVKSFKLKNHDEGIVYGFIAQDELERNPELVVVPENYSQEEDGGELMYMPNNVLFLAVKAIQELSAKVDDLEKQLKELEK